MKNFKDSGIEWLGEIPQHWEIRKLKYLATIYNGKDQSYITSDDGIFPIYGSGGIIGKTHQFLYDKQSVLLGRKGTIDKPLFVEIPFWTIDTMFYTKISCSTYPKYFYYLCLTIDFKTYISGSAIPSMTQSDLIEIIFPFAPLKEQEQIANFLDKKCEKIDLLIEKTEKQIKLINQAVCGRIDL
ncbi:type I restriction endonuclease subunit S [Campylobacter lari]|nr:type I restriction endonuclease subunit S [Campylobacter lari]EJV5920634.1 restriction endonuclease subunit S [Campylobacter lari]